MVNMRGDTRHTIITTAAELFYRQGYNLTGINQIIKESGIAKATLYSHFKSKEDLLMAYLDFQDTELLKQLAEYTRNKSEGNDRLIAVLEFLIPFFNQDDFNGCWCIRSIGEVTRDNHKIRSKIQDNKKAFRTFLKKLIVKNKPKLEKEQQEQLTNELYLLYEGAITESYLHEAKWPIETAISLLKDKLKRV